MWSLCLPDDIGAQVSRICEDALDVLLIATNVAAVFNPATVISMHRLARTQIALGTYPATTGMSQMDCFLSSELTEPRTGAEHQYTEFLVLMSGVFNCFVYGPEPAAPAAVPSRERLMLGGTRRSTRRGPTSTRSRRSWRASWRGFRQACLRSIR